LHQYIILKRILSLQKHSNVVKKTVGVNTPQRLRPWRRFWRRGERESAPGPTAIGVRAPLSKNGIRSVRFCLSVQVYSIFNWIGQTNFRIFVLTFLSRRHPRRATATA